MIKLLEIIIDLILPPRCAACNSIIAIDQQDLLCNECDESFEPIGAVTCIKCGAPVEKKDSTCAVCYGRETGLTSNYALFLYEGSARLLIINFKYKRGPSVMKLIKSIIEKNFDSARLDKIDGIIYVPMYKRKEKRRGYNQAKLLAKALSEVTGIKLYEDVLVRARDTKPQSGLNYHMRRKNLKDAFTTGSGINGILSKAILLVDDIYTTGSTMSECARILLAHGAVSVSGFTFTVRVKQNTK